jgi:hypothetical protein
MARLPSVYQVSAALIIRLGPYARARRRFLRHAVLSGWEALSRRDFELMLVRYAPDVVFEAHAGFQALGISGYARGRGEMVHVLEEILDVWDQFALAPAAIVDLGGEVSRSGPTPRCRPHRPEIAGSNLPRYRV